MATETSTISGIASQAMDVGGTLTWAVLIMGFVAIIIFLVWFILQHKHRVMIKILTENGSIVVFDKAREVTRGGVTMWRLLKRRHSIPPPPPEARQLTKKGKILATCYYTDDVGYVWGVDTVRNEKFKETTQTRVMVNGTEVPVTRKIYEPASAQQRSLLANALKEAALRRGQSGWDKFKEIIPALLLVVVIVCVFLFWEEIAKPVQQLQESNAAISEQNARISEQNARMLIFLYGPNAGNLSVAQSIPPDGGSLG